MKVLDRYVLCTFAKVFLGSALAFSVGLVTLDFFGRINYFFDAGKVEGTFAEDYSSLRLIFLFYAAYLPFLLKEVLPFITVAGGLFTVTHMLKNNEVAPVVAAGTSVRRLFLPLFLSGAAIAAGHFAFQEFAVPALSREQIALKRFFQGDRAQGTHDLAHLRDGRGSVTRAGYYAFGDGSLENVVVQRPWDQGGFEIWKAARLEPDGDGWVATGGVEVQPKGVDQLPRRLPPGSRIDFGVTPDEVNTLASRKGTQELSLTQLRRLAAKFPDRRHLRVAVHKQVARPFASLAMLLLGVPVLLSVGRSYFAGAGIALTLSAVYYFLDVFFTSLGDRGDLPAVFAAYFPLTLLLSLGVARLLTVPT